MSLSRIIDINVSYNAQASYTTVQLFANSNDTLRVTLLDASGAAVDFSAVLASTGTYVKPMVTIVPGADVSTGVAVRTESATGVTPQPDGNAQGYSGAAATAAAAGQVSIAIQAADLTNAMAGTPVWLEVWLIENVTTPTVKILAALIQVQVIKN